MVYVDNTRFAFRGMIMSHMTADSEQELLEFADALGLERRWYQDKASWPHFDVCQTVRKRAISMGAKAIGWREMARFTISQKERIHLARMAFRWLLWCCDAAEVN